MISFDESDLVRKLSALSPWRRAVFAALVAERLMPGCERVESADGRNVQETLTKALTDLWNRIQVVLPGVVIQQEINSCMSLLPTDAESWARANPFAEEVIAAAIYALQSLHSESAREAAWAARRGYEAVDRFVIAQGRIDIGTTAGEKEILNNPLVQSELRSQLEDLANLSDPTFQSEGKRLSQLRALARSKAHTYLRRGY